MIDLNKSKIFGYIDVRVFYFHFLISYSSEIHVVFLYVVRMISVTQIIN